MDGVTVTNMDPSGGGLTCLLTSHSLMPIDKWVVRRWLGFTTGRRRRKLTRHRVSDTKQPLLLFAVEVKNPRRERILVLCVCVFVCRFT